MIELWGHKELLTQILFSPNGNQVLGVCQAGVLVAWDLPAGKRLYSLRVDEGPPFELAYSPDSRFLAIGTCDKEKEGTPGVLSLYDARSGKRLWQVNGPRTPYRISFSPDGRMIGYKARGIRLHDTSDGKSRGVLRCSKYNNGGPVWSPDGKRIAASGPYTVKGWIEVFDVASAKPLSWLGDFDEPAQRLSFSKDGKELTSLHKDGKERIWDLATNKQKSVRKSIRHLLEKEPYPVTVLSPDTKLIAACDDKAVVRLFDTTSGKQLWSVAPRYDGAEKFAVFGDVLLVFSPDGRWLATATHDWAFEIWDLKKILKKR
jgi:Tol biopolymer transport system component